MKKFLALLVAGLAATAVVARDETLIDESDAWMMYTRPELSLSDIGGHSATMGSLSVGWMLNDKLSLGPSVTFGLSDTRDDALGDIERFDVWYAGLRAEYTFYSYKLVHASASVLVGGGNASVSNYSSKDDNTGFAVVEPGVNVAVNAWDWVEIGVGIGYRWVDSISVGGYDEKDFEDWNIGVFARFTEF